MRRQLQRNGQESGKKRKYEFFAFALKRGELRQAKRTDLRNYTASKANSCKPCNCN